jgi:hypothetical protein
MPELAFLLPDPGAGPAVELTAALAAAVGRQDAAVLRAASPPPPRPDRVHVLLSGVVEEAAEPPPTALPRTILIFTAPPGSTGFERGAERARQAGAVFHANPAAVERLLELGVPARHLQLGYAVEWDRWDPGRPAELETIADCGGYFDWPRALAAMHGGRVVLHEAALGMAPLVAGRHLFVATSEALEDVATALRRDQPRLDKVRQQAHEFLRGALPLGLAAAALVGAARTLVAQPSPVGSGSTPGRPALGSK